MKIQQVSFDGKRVGAKRRPVSHVGDRIKTLRAITAADSCTRDVHAVFRSKLFIVRQINSRDRIFRAVTAPPSGGGENAERTSQQMPRPADPAGGKQFADMAARNPLAAQPHL